MNSCRNTFPKKRSKYSHFNQPSMNPMPLSSLMKAALGRPDFSKSRYMNAPMAKDPGRVEISVEVWQTTIWRIGMYKLSNSKLKSVDLSSNELAQSCVYMKVMSASCNPCKNPST